MYSLNEYLNIQKKNYICVNDVSVFLMETA